MRRLEQLDCNHCHSKALSVFCQLENLALRRLNHEKVANHYAKGQVLFLQGNPPFGLYAIHRGKVKITKTGTDGKETIVRIAAAGQLIGHRSLFSDTAYSASAVALEDSTVCFINKTIVFDLVRSDPRVAEKVISTLSEDLGSAEDRIASMAQKNVRERFAELILLLARSYGRSHESGTRLDIKLTREEMGAMIGTTPESLIRLITEFKKEGLLCQEGKTLIVQSTEQLECYTEIKY